MQTELRQITVIVVLLLASNVCLEVVEAARPNIVLIVADDLGWNDVGFHGSEIKTPNIDKLAYDGVILNNYYVSPICTPTRGSLMTGRHPIHLGLQHGVIRAPEPWGLPLNHSTMAKHLKYLGYSTHIVGKCKLCSVGTGLSLKATVPHKSQVYYSFTRWSYSGETDHAGKATVIPWISPESAGIGFALGLQHYVISAPEPWGLPLNHTTMAQHMKSLGYATHIVGKWHLGFFREEYLPTNRGFDSHFGYWTGKEDYFDHLDYDWNLGYFKNEYLPNRRGFDLDIGMVYNGLDFRNNLDVVNKTEYSTEVYTKAAVNIINSHNKSKPLFLYLAHQAVHAGNGDDPLQVPQPYVDRFPYISSIRRRIFAGMAAALDDSVGEVVRALNHNGMMANTIIVFTTDNGGPANNYDLNAACNHPLRGTKNTLWEGGVHGVGFVHSQLLKMRQVKTDNMMHVSDWLPTLYSAAGGDISNLGTIDGIDMWDMLLNNGSSKRNAILHNIDPKSKFSAIRVGDYKLVQGDISGGKYDGWYPCNPPIQAKLKSKYDLAKNEYNGRAIYAQEHEPNTPYIIRCANPPVNSTDSCDPAIAPCLFHIPTDPCEYNNLASAYPEVVNNLIGRIDEYARSAVDPVNKPVDKLADPAFHGGVWVPWQG